MKITKIHGREGLDSRGFPALACFLELDNGRKVCASVPSGASVGVHEAVELRDGDPQWFFGKGVSQAIQNLEQKIAPMLVGKTPDIIAMDRMMIELDGTENKSNLGANAILAASIAVTRAQALVNNVEVFQLLHKLYPLETADITSIPSSSAYRGTGVTDLESPPSRGENLFSSRGMGMPRCMFNIINGGLHADSGLVFQEFMIMPRQILAIKDQLHMTVTIYQTLKKILHEEGLATSVGDEGGFAPHIEPGHRTREKVALGFF